MILRECGFPVFRQVKRRGVLEKLNTTEEKIRLMKMDEAFWEMSMLEFLPISE